MFVVGYREALMLYSFHKTYVVEWVPTNKHPIPFVEVGLLSKLIHQVSESSQLTTTVQWFESSKLAARDAV